MALPVAPENETTRFFPGLEQPNSTHGSRTFQDQSSRAKINTSVARVLPLAFLAAMAMAATAATSLFTYASLLCNTPTHCDDSERHAYAGAVAMASFAANVCGLLVLGPMETLSRRNNKAGLALWFGFRCMSVLMLVIGYHLRSISVALTCQIFEGFASDNLLHFNLNAIYVQTPIKEQVSKLIGSSLALYMIGISISPFVASRFDDISSSIILSLGFFAIAFIYLLTFVKPRESDNDSDPLKVGNLLQGPRNASADSQTRSCCQKVMNSIISPLQAFHALPVMLSGLSLLIYNTGQAFTFSAIMIHTTLRFGFSAKQNGLLISIAHSTASVYVFFALFVIPRTIEPWRHPKSSSSLRTHSTADALYALLALTAQAISFVLLALANQSWQVYPVIVLLALGLATPSFIKSYTIHQMSRSEAPQAIAALAIMEASGALISPLTLGGVQTVWPGTAVLFGAFMMMAGSAVLLGLVVLMHRTTEV